MLSSVENEEEKDPEHQPDQIDIEEAKIEVNAKEKSGQIVLQQNLNESVQNSGGEEEEKIEKPLLDGSQSNLS